MKRFKLNRLEDESGVSGTGTVAEGCLFSNGTVVVIWYGEYSSTNIYQSMADMIHIHGHGGKTKVVWVDAWKQKPKRYEMLEKYVSGPVRPRK